MRIFLNEKEYRIFGRIYAPKNGEIVVSVYADGGTVDGLEKVFEIADKITVRGDDGSAEEIYNGFNSVETITKEYVYINGEQTPIVTAVLKEKDHLKSLEETVDMLTEAILEMGE